MITLHHLEKSRSHRIAWLLEELGLVYDFVAYERDPQTSLAPPELKAVHPLGKSPVIVDDAVTVAESGAIVEYLIETYAAGRMRPGPGTEARRDDTYWMHYSEGSLMVIVLMGLVFGRIATQKGPPLVGSIVRQVGKRGLAALVDRQMPEHLAAIDEWLAAREWFAGGQEPTGADIMMSFPLQAVMRRRPGSQLANIAAFVARLEARPAWARAVERVGPLRLLGED